MSSSTCTRQTKGAEHRGQQNIRRLDAKPKGLLAELDNGAYDIPLAGFDMREIEDTMTAFAEDNTEADNDFDADRICREFVGFVQRLRTKRLRLYIKCIFAADEAQYLINSLRKTIRQNRLALKIGDSAK